METATSAPASQEIEASQQPVEKRRFGGSHPSRANERVKLVHRNSLDGRTGAARKWDVLVAQIKTDLGGDLSAIELALVEAFCGTTVMLDDMHVRVLLGQQIVMSDYCTLASTLTRLGSRLGLRRRPRTVDEVSLGKYLARQEDGMDE